MAAHVPTLWVGLRRAWHRLAASEDGATLAMGSTTGGLWVSTSGGERWECVSRDLPPIAVLRFA